MSFQFTESFNSNENHIIKSLQRVFYAHRSVRGTVFLTGGFIREVWSSLNCGLFTDARILQTAGNHQTKSIKTTILLLFKFRLFCQSFIIVTYFHMFVVIVGGVLSWLLHFHKPDKMGIFKVRHFSTYTHDANYISICSYDGLLMFRWIKRTEYKLCTNRKRIFLYVFHQFYGTGKAGSELGIENFVKVQNEPKYNRKIYCRNKICPRI